MKKNVWVLCSNKKTLTEVQRKINEGGGMKAYCLTSYVAVEKAVSKLATYGNEKDQPSLLIADFETGQEEEFASLYFLKIQPGLAGIPLFFMCDKNTPEMEKQCYELGATVILTKPFDELAIQRIERVSWQHEMTRNYEQMLMHQASELENAKEIRRLNDLLESRNDLLGQIFGKYFSEEVVRSILDDPTGSMLGGKKTEVTVLMADLRGFTSLSDTISGEMVVDILNTFLQEMTEIIKQHHGTIIEIIGDEILAVFGAPVESNSMVADAIAAAISMQNSMRKVNRYNSSKNYPLIEMGIGIHKGEVFIGNIGSEYLMRYNVIGKAVNLCSRIESYTFGGQILISLETLEDVKDICTPGDTFWISMKGFRKQIPICEIDQIDIEGEEPYHLTHEKSKPLHYISHEPIVMLYLIQDKFIGEYSIEAKAVEISDKKMVLEVLHDDLEASHLALHCEVEVLMAGKSAYGKIIKVKDNSLMLRFTYQPEGFYEACISK